MVCLDKRTEEGISFSSARLLIDICVWHNVHGWVYLSINGKGFDVFVKETGKENFS